MNVDEIKKAAYDRVYRNRFYEACIEGDLDLAKKLYDKGMLLGIDIHLHENGSTIMGCLSMGLYDVVKYLLTIGASISSLNVLNKDYYII